MTNSNQNYSNQFTAEYWQGHQDRKLAPNYVTRLQLESFYAPMIYTGRINGVRCDDQMALKSLKADVLADKSPSNSRP